MDDFREKLNAVATATEQSLTALLPNDAGNPMADPMRHAVLNGGKRLRAFLAVESAALYDEPVPSLAHGCRHRMYARLFAGPRRSALHGRR